jgi:outer membrane protein assembly factor BamB
MGTRRAIAILVLGVLAPAGAAAQAFDPGKPPLWHVPGEARGTPVHDGGTVYFLSKLREVVAVNADTGEVRWRGATGVTSSDAIFGATTAGTSLVVTDRHVVAGDWDIVGFDKATGRRIWTYQAPAGDGPGLFLGAAAAGVVYAGSPGGKVYAIDADTGRLRWMTTVVEGGATSVFPPVVQGTVVAAGYSTFSSPNVGGLSVLDAGTGRVRWRRQFPDPRERWQHTNLSGGPVVIDDLVIGSAGDGNIHAFDLTTGAVRWAFPRLTGDLTGLVTTTDVDHRAITRSGRLIVAGSATGHVVAYDVDTQRERWRFAAGYSGSTTFGLAADDRFVYVPFFGGFIVAVDVVTGEERWRTGDFRMGFIWPPAPAGDRVYAGAAYAGFFALAVSPQEVRR